MEHKIIQYLKDHKLKNVINDIINIIKPLKDILIKLLLKENTLTIHLIYSTTIIRHQTEAITKEVKEVTKNYKNILIKEFFMHEERFNTLRGFN